MLGVRFFEEQGQDATVTTIEEPREQEAATYNGRAAGPIVRAFFSPLPVAKSALGVYGSFSSLPRWKILNGGCMTDSLIKNLAHVREAITRAAESAGRAPASVRLLAVSKTKPAEVIQQAYDAGQRLFGENRVQDLRGKYDQLPADCEWHFIGPLQKNKVRQAVQVIHWLHSLDSVKLVERVNRIADEEGRSLNVLVEVNISGESTKHGCAPSAAAAVMEAVARSPRLTPKGLMTLAPYQAPEEELRRVFRGLRELRDSLQDQVGVDLPELSMGMSGDFPIAIAEGATIVRVGTAIFGSR